MLLTEDPRSFFQKFSLDPLQCTRAAMLRTMEDCQVPPMFLDVIKKVGNQPQVFEESSGFRQACQSADGSFG
jgi:hypothetical protein